MRQSMARFALLVAAARLAVAKQPAFSVHDDLASQPQYEIVIEGQPRILHADATALIEGTVKPSGRPTISQGIPDTAQTPDDSDSDSTDPLDDIIDHTYELLSVPPHRYLCSIPVLASPAPGFANKTAADLAREEEARELARAERSGRDLISTFEGQCLYFGSGWWSYSFCYGEGVVQFHAVASKNGNAIKDPNSMEYVLGRMQPQPDRLWATDDHAQKQKPIRGKGSSSDADPHTIEIRVKGDQKYMVQRLADGTVCDLTGRPRTIEIQYHCSPGASQDRIAWIREVTTCSYLMEIRTPRLCQDPAFTPPKPTHAHPITCRLVVEDAALLDAPLDAGVDVLAHGASSAPTKVNTIGGIAIGAQHIVPEDVQNPKLHNTKTAKAAAKAFRSASNKAASDADKAKLGDKENGPAAGQIARTVVAYRPPADDRSEGVLEIVPVSELAELGIDMSHLVEAVGKLGAMAGDRAWSIEAFFDESTGEMDLRAIVDPDVAQDVESREGTETEAETMEKTKIMRQLQYLFDALGEPRMDLEDEKKEKKEPAPTEPEAVATEPAAAEPAADEGSEETFKDEL